MFLALVISWDGLDFSQHRSGTPAQNNAVVIERNSSLRKAIYYKVYGR
jgi:hypothetical protein